MFDVRVFNPFAPSNRQANLTTTYTKHEKEKKEPMAMKVREVEFASFSLLVFSLTGGLGREATTVYKDSLHCLQQNGSNPTP